MNKLNVFLTLLLMFAFGVPAFAQVSPINVQTVAEKEEQYVNEKGQTETRLVPVVAVVPGDRVVYTVTFSNEGDQPATGVVVTDPIPAQMRYVDGSAYGPGTEITFSVDGGDVFADASNLLVTDGSGNSRPARAQDYTHVRWAFTEVLEPGARGYARFQAVLD